MAAFISIVDSSWSGISLAFTAVQNGTQIDSASATTTQLASGVYKVTGSLDLSTGSEGEIEIVLADAAGNVAEIKTIYMKSDETILDSKEIINDTVTDTLTAYKAMKADHQYSVTTINGYVQTTFGE